ncbi:FAD:protein FMN transferase [Kineosporia rhizophila]|uniref:FAD:protein FMN transferase n=1 Tax=Kineosporia TaxID=49184 RepID=UPI001E591650|nr:MULTISPECIES: FAD:protein FMN transferase [Kineosporia]MCE0534339.1 FAD:protein FMN transferase [Kineosporia rhizophila]GLY13887.1 FAD:protein FMN transferase [Kineosporia sp. NBRC 101677]
MPVQETAVRYGTARWNALGTYVALVVSDADRLDAARAACERILADVDQAASRFRTDSDLTRANRHAGEWVGVAPLLCRALSAAVWAADLTDGLVDPTLGRQLLALGYDRDIEELRRSMAAGQSIDSTVTPGMVSTDPARASFPARTGAWREIEIDPQGAVRVPSDVSLDLGATGKAFAADLIAGTVPALADTDLVISLGGDIAVGLRPDTEPGTHPWRVSVTELPEVPQPLGGREVPPAAGPGSEVVVIHEGGLATSSVLARRWYQDGDRHHLLDPRTGRPVEEAFRTVTACGCSCVEANAISTSSIVRGAAALAWLEAEDVAARLVAADGTVHRVAGWPENLAVSA